MEASLEQLSAPLPPWAIRAGARETIYHDPRNTTAAIVTCGGLCPGLNDVVAVSRTVTGKGLQATGWGKGAGWSRAAACAGYTADTTDCQPLNPTFPVHQEQASGTLFLPHKVSSLACLSACLLACLPACMHACMQACPPDCLPACLCVCLPACLRICLLVCPGSGEQADRLWCA